MATNALAPKNQNLDNVRALLEKSKKQIALALPKHMNPDRIARIAITSVQKTPALLNCNPISLVGAVVEAAQLGLEPDSVSGEAALIPFKGKVQLIPMYKGLLKLARNSGQIGPVRAQVVYNGDAYKYQEGLSPVLEHTPSDKPQGEKDIIAFYAVAIFLGHEKPQFEWMWKWEVDRIRGNSPAGSKKDAPWTTHYVEMGKKTVIRRLCKLLPSSPELQKAIALDELADIGLDQDLSDVIDISVDEQTGEIMEEEPKSQLDELVDKESKESKGNGEKKGMFE